MQEIFCVEADKSFHLLFWINNWYENPIFLYIWSDLNSQKLVCPLIVSINHWYKNSIFSDIWSDINSQEQFCPLIFSIPSSLFLSNYNLAVGSGITCHFHWYTCMVPQISMWFIRTTLLAICVPNLQIKGMCKGVLRKSCCLFKQRMFKDQRTYT